MTYKPSGKRSTKVFDASQYSGNLPQSVDWRTNNAVTSIKDQVKLLLYDGSVLLTIESYGSTGSVWS